VLYVIILGLVYKKGSLKEEDDDNKDMFLFCPVSFFNKLIHLSKLKSSFFSPHKLDNYDAIHLRTFWLITDSSHALFELLKCPRLLAISPPPQPKNVLNMIVVPCIFLFILGD